jgi:hypothetical protein
VIPRSVEFLGSGCLSHCYSLSSISFESDSRLTRIESQAFPPFNRKIVIPSTICFVAYDAIPTVSRLVLIYPDLYPEFNRWRELRKREIDIDFRRVLRVGLGFVDLKAYIVNLQAFEEGFVESGCDEIGNAKYQREEDGCLMIVTSIDVSDCFEQNRIEHAIENLVNMRHPCINNPIGFVLPTDSGGIGEMNILRLCSGFCSLAEVI